MAARTGRHKPSPPPISWEPGAGSWELLSVKPPQSKYSLKSLIPFAKKIALLCVLILLKAHTGNISLRAAPTVQRSQTSSFRRSVQCHQTRNDPPVHGSSHACAKLCPIDLPPTPPPIFFFSTNSLHKTPTPDSSKFRFSCRTCSLSVAILQTQSSLSAAYSAPSRFSISLE
jgi:hypothetical protein